MILPWHLYLMAFLYIAAGINHFRVPRVYHKIIPASFPKPHLINYIAGLAEIVLGSALCYAPLTSFAAWGIIALLVAIFPSNLYMYRNNEAGLGLPRWLRLLRLPMQLLLLFWALQYTTFYIT